MYRCPTCGAPLKPDPRRYTCSHGHGYDRGRSGYVNLLTGRRRQTGDTDEMVRARRAALDTGAYGPLRDYLVDLNLHGDAIDVGCGEGYFTRAIMNDSSGWRAAIDTSTLAARLAAGRDKTTEYAVADAFNLPIADDSVDVVWSVLGPVVPSEFARTIRPGGTVVTVSPGPRHLWEMKQLLLASPTRHPGRPPAGLHGLSGETQSDRLTFDLDLDAEVANSLFAMTPYSRAHRQRSLPDRLVVTADFLVTTVRLDG